MATLESAGKALSIMACMCRTASEIEDIKVKEKAEQETTLVQTMGEAIVLKEGEKRNPPLNHSDLKRTVGTFTGLIYVLYGPACDFYKKLWGIYKALKHERVAEMEDKFTGTFCKKIVWAIISDKCDYFSTRIHPDAFKNDLDEPDFPSSGLSTIIPNIRQQEQFNWGSFPEAWKPKPTYAPRVEPSTSLGTQANKNKLQLQKQTWVWKPQPMPGGAPPVFSQNVGTPVKSELDTLRSGGAMVEKRGETNSTTCTPRSSHS